MGGLISKGNYGIKRGIAVVMTKTERLEKVLEIAKEQRKLVAYEDLDAITRLQEKREVLLNGLQFTSRNKEKYDKDIIAQIINLDREMKWLLSERMINIQTKIQDLAIAKEKLRADRSSRKQTPQHLSCRA